MIALLQRVSYARVKVEHKIIGEIDQGLLVFLAVEKEDTETKAQRLLKRVLGYRIFSDTKDMMNLSVRDVNGGVLVVSQFTLAADTQKGMRPSFTPAATPEEGRRLYEYFLHQARLTYHKVSNGEFGANMQVELCNDGPVTIWLKS